MSNQTQPAPAAREADHAAQPGVGMNGESLTKEMLQILKDNSQQLAEVILPR
jgi:hypothetical protein